MLFDLYSKSSAIRKFDPGLLVVYDEKILSNLEIILMRRRQNKPTT